MSSERDYKTLNEELNKVLDDLQNGELDIDEAVELYEKGIKLTKQLEQHLKTSKNKVSKINTDFSL